MPMRRAAQACAISSAASARQRTIRVLMLAQEPLLQLLEPSLRAMIDRVPQARSRIVTAQDAAVRVGPARDAAAARSWMARHIRDFKKGYEVAEISLHHRVSVE